MFLYHTYGVEMNKLIGVQSIPKCQSTFRKEIPFNLSIHFQWGYIFLLLKPNKLMRNSIKDPLDLKIKKYLLKFSIIEVKDKRLGWAVGHIRQFLLINQTNQHQRIREAKASSRHIWH